MAPHSSTVARKIPWMEDPGRLQSMRSLRVRHEWVTSLSLSTFMHCRRKWQPTPVFLPGESHGWRSLVGCSPWGCTESDTTEVTWQQQDWSPGPFDFKVSHSNVLPFAWQHITTALLSSLHFSTKSSLIIVFHSTSPFHELNTYYSYFIHLLIITHTYTLCYIFRASVLFVHSLRVWRFCSMSSL